MPVKVTKYTCKHKCGHSAISSEKLMIEHEEKHCFKNPAMKTCETCIHRIYEKGGYDFESDYITCHNRGCKVPEMNDFLEDVQDLLIIKSSVKQHVKPLFNCPYHNFPIMASIPVFQYYRKEVKRLLLLHNKPSIEQDQLF